MLEIVNVRDKDILAAHIVGNSAGRFHEVLPGFFVETDANKKFIGFECLDFSTQDVGLIAAELPVVRCTIVSAKWTRQFASFEEFLRTMQCLARNEPTSL